MPDLIAIVLAHDWGWDEILYFAVPLLAVLYWVRRAEKRAASNREAERSEDDDAAKGTPS